MSFCQDPAEEDSHTGRCFPQATDQQQNFTVLSFFAWTMAGKITKSSLYLRAAQRAHSLAQLWAVVVDRCTGQEIK